MRHEKQSDYSAVNLSGVGGAHPSPSVGADPPVEVARRRPKWHLLYFLLAAFDIVTVSASLAMNHMLTTSFEESVALNSKWSDRLGQYANLSELATNVNMPGNEVFDTLDVATESHEQRIALGKFESALISARNELQTNVDPTVAAPLLAQLDDVATAMSAMTLVQEEIFNHFLNDEATKAGSKMATMDRDNANVAEAIGTMGVLVRDLQKKYFAEQSQRAELVSQLEIVIAFMIVVMVIAVTLYGHKIAQQVSQSEADLRAAASRAQESSAQAVAALHEVSSLRTALDRHTLFSVTDRRGIITEVNDGFCQISGYSREELIGQNHRLLNSGHHPKSFWADMWKTIAGGKPWRAAVCNRAKDGSLYWVDSTNLPQLDADGKIEKYISLRFDITKQKYAEQESIRVHQQLDEQHAELQSIIDAIPAFIYYKDDANTILDLNKTAAESIGLPAEEIRGRNTDEFFPAEDAALFLEADLEVIRGGKPKLGIVEEHEAQGGERLHIRTDKIPLRGPSGKFERLVAVATDITELTNARGELEQLQQRFERAANGAHDGLWDYEPATGAAWYSDQFKRLIGLPEEHFDSFEPHIDSFAETIHPLDRDRAEEAMRAHLSDGEPYEVRFRLRMATNEIRWFLARGHATLDEAGNPLRMSGSISDIDDQHTAESRLKLATDSAGIGLWDWDVPTGDTYFNDTFYALLGYEPDELPMHLGTWHQRIHPDDRERALDNIRRHTDGITPIYTDEHRLEKKDGSWLWVREIGEVVERSEDQSPKRMIGVHIDIDEIKKSEAALSEITTALDASKDCVFMFDVETLAFVYTNRGASQQVGYSPTEMQEMTPLDIKPHFDLDDFNALIQPLKDDPSQATVFRTDHQHRDGHLIPVEISLQLVPEFRGSGRFLAIVRDISGQLEAERQLERACQEAEAANQSKSEFLANMSHEIRTPMTAILGYADLLDDTEADISNDPAQAAEAISTIQRNAHHLLTIINDILDMSKIEAGAMIIEQLETGAVHIVEDVASILRPRAIGKGIELCVRYETGLPEYIRTDPTRLRQILLNLVGNAIKFTEVGRVTIAVSCEPEASQMKFRVVDSGIGMTPSQRDAIARFAAFNQADTSTTRKFGGTGLGLRISNALAQKLGGGIEIESQENQGSTFTVTIDTGPIDGIRILPLEEVDVEAIPRQKSPEEKNEPTPKKLKGVRVLIAEDGPDNQRLLSFLLRKAGAEVTVVDNGLIAVETLEKSDAEQLPHVVLMDMQMPVLDGYEATRRLREGGHSVPILALTAHAMEDDRKKCLDAGCDGFLTKPVNKSELIETCARFAKDLAVESQ